MMEKSLLRLKERSLRQLFWVTLLGTVVLKSLLAVIIPLTGDEAYYAIWGKFFRWGYYDHTPMIGWLLHPFVAFGFSNFMSRLPTVIITTIMAIVIYRLLSRYDVRRAALIGILFLISPLILGGVFITTDTPLIFFSFLSGVFLFLAIKNSDHLGYYFAAGLCLGLAFFSKYFAVLLALAYLCYFLFSTKSWKRTVGFILVFLAVLPFGLENLYWNYTHGWANILFNVYNRNESMHFSWHTMVVYLLILLYIVTPIIVYYLCKHAKQVFSRQKPAEFNLLVFLFVVPFLFFFGLSAYKSIGLHWPLAFVGFIYLMLVLILSEKELINSIRFMIIFTGFHLLLIGTILLLPVQMFQAMGVHGKKYADLVFALKHPQVRNYLKRYENDFVIASNSYAKADLMYFDSGIYSPTFGHGSVHGREGDFLTDYRLMNHKNFVILSNKHEDLSRYKPYFRQVSEETFTLYNADFYLVVGYHFNYEKYRTQVLRLIDKRYWQVPHYLPYRETFYCRKYFDHCPSRKIL